MLLAVPPSIGLIDSRAPLPVVDDAGARRHCQRDGVADAGERCWPPHADGERRVPVFVEQLPGRVAELDGGGVVPTVAVQILRTAAGELLRLRQGLHLDTVGAGLGAMLDADAVD